MHSPVSETKSLPHAKTYKNFRLGKMLGRGAAGHVYEGFLYDRPQEKLAIKIIEKKLFTCPEMLTRTRNEIEIHKSLIHPNVLRLYTSHEDSHYFYLFMEYCAKGELYSYLKKVTRRPLTELEARWFFKGLVDGISYLHKLGIVHRDLKLSNLLISFHYELKIADFGLAVKAACLSFEKHVLCGTPNYLSPEILLKKNYDYCVDLWCLGIILYTLLVGSPPFEGETMKETLQNIVHCKYFLPNYLSPLASHLIKSLLVKDVSQRLKAAQVQFHKFIVDFPYQIFKEFTQKQPSSPFPLNTFVLKKTSYKTLFGQITCNSDNSFTLALKNTVENIQISKDGSVIVISRRRGVSSNNDNDSSMELVFSISYLASNLGFPMKALYLYIIQFIHYTQSKIPKILMQIPNAKCYLMFNSPEPVMRVRFLVPNNICCLYCPSKRILKIIKIIPGPPQKLQHYKLNLPLISKNNAQVSFKILKLVKYVLYYYSLCLDLDRNLKYSHDGSLPALGKDEEEYPLVFTTTTTAKQKKISYSEPFSAFSQNISLSLLPETSTSTSSSTHYHLNSSSFSHKKDESFFKPHLSITNSPTLVPLSSNISDPQNTLKNLH